MCGIAGILAAAPLNSDDAAAARTMADAIAHRGPDGHAVWSDSDAGIALAHRRLAIVDLSPAGAQPMASASGRYVLAYNGEVYNHRALRRALEEAGHASAWRGHSDTEVLLALIEARGFLAALEAVNGMFALALWDRHERRLHLARDRIGEKPLYYGIVDGRLLFASELKAIARHPRFAGAIDRDALGGYLRYGYVPAPRSIWQGIAKLPPGHVATFADAEPIGEPTPFWRFEDAARAGLADPLPDDDALIDRVEALLGEAVALRMEADVPLGAFLSGGIDSSLVTALMQQRASLPVRTFSIGFTDPAYDESRHARRVAAHLGTAHEELILDPAEARDTLPSLAHIWDEPFADSSQLPTYLVSRLARRHVTVALSGDGGDELFAGYNRHVIAARTWDAVRRLPYPLRRGIGGAMQHRAVAALADRVGAHLPSRYRILGIRDRFAKAGMVVAARSPDDFYHQLVTIGPGNGALLAATAPGPPAAHGFDDVREAMLYLDATTYLPDDILVKVDRASMAVGLEGRVPFLDHRLIELAWRVPMSAKVRDGRGKHILRRILDRHVPRALIDRPKSGFAMPIARWLATDLRDWAEHLLDPRRLREGGLLDPAAVGALWQRFRGGDHALQNRVWTILMFEAWREAQDAHATSYDRAA